MKIGIAVVLSSIAFIPSLAAWADGPKRLEADLVGYNEPPSISTPASGEFDARLLNDDQEIHYRLSYGGFEAGTTVLQAHIHLGQRGVNGGISVWLCGNPSVTPPVNPPIGVQGCPPFPATIEGIIKPEHVIGPTAQGITAGEFNELVRAIRAGATYVNVHTNRFPGGEIRDQIRSDRGRHHH